MFRNFHAGYGPAHQYGKNPFYEKFRGGGSFRRPKNNVPVNIIDQESRFEVHVYALGFNKENITISVSDDLLRINGTRQPGEDQDPQFLRQEYPIKSFERVVQLNDKVDVTTISARQENGVLIVTLPKKPDALQSEQTIEIA